MKDNVVGFGWTGWMIPRSLIEASMLMLETPFSDDLRRLLEADDNLTCADLEKLRMVLLQKLESLTDREGLIGIQSPLVSGQTTDETVGSEGRNVHLLTVLAVAIQTVVGGWHVSHEPASVTSGG